MKRRSSLLSAAMLVVATLTSFGPARPASADACVGTALVTVGAPGLVYPLTPALSGTTLTIQGDRPLAWGFGTAFGTCAPSFVPPSGAGLLQGYCGHATGWAVDNSGHGFVFTNVGSLLVLAGPSKGIGQWLPNPPSGESCITGASSFVFTFAMSRDHCLVSHTVGAFPSTPFVARSVLSARVVVEQQGVGVYLHPCVGIPLP
jgi:hypothetical protein